MTQKHTPGPWRIGSQCKKRSMTWIGGSNEKGGAVLPYIAIINWPDGTDDSITLSGSLEEIQEQAPAEIERRGASNPWSEILED